MFTIKKVTYLIIAGFLVTSCVSKKQYNALQAELDSTNERLSMNLEKSQQEFQTQGERLELSESTNQELRADLNTTSTQLSLREEQIEDMRSQLEDCQEQRNQQLQQVGNLTALSQAASENIKSTLNQLENKDQYIRVLQNARTKADSLNLALAINLKSVLADGIADEDVEIKVDKTVVFVNLSDKMLYRSGSSGLSSRAREILGKIATILESRPDLEVMVEGYTDNIPIRNSCITDNWDLSVKRATSVVRLLQNEYNIDPNRLIAAGRGEYNTLASNDTAEGRSTNRRTRIIILPKLDQFYDLLNPSQAPR